MSGNASLRSLLPILYFRLLTMAGLDQIKRQARKEAWYGDSYNPFGKGKRSSTFPNHPPPDLETGNGGVLGGAIGEDETPLSAVQTEPPHSGNYSQTTNGDAIRRPSKENEYQMTTATATNTSKPREADSEETVVASRSSRPRSNEEKARRRFVGKFFKKKNESSEPDDAPKKRPWYKGKELYHEEPFTFRNQIQRTIFSSWINLLLIAAPVGIALNYAGVDGKVVFTVNFIAIIPLAGMLSFATEEIALHLGESLGGLLNASFGCVYLLV
jgi:Ca2+:H+ antiporter